MLATQLCPTLCDPMDCSPSGSSVHGISQARILEVGCHFFLQGIFLTQRSNLHPLHVLHWPANSFPLRHLAGIKIARRNLQLQIGKWNHSNGRKWRTKEPLDEGKRREWKAGLRLNIQKTNFMASCPITSWQIKGEKVETVTDFLFLDSKITADGGCRHEIKRFLLLGRKAMTNLEY